MKVVAAALVMAGGGLRAGRCCRWSRDGTGWRSYRTSAGGWVCAAGVAPGLGLSLGLAAGLGRGGRFAVVLFFVFRHGGPPFKALHQGGLTMGSVSIHTEPTFRTAGSIYKPTQGAKHCISCTMGPKR